MVNATPNIPGAGNTSSARGIKVASPDIIQLSNDSLPVDFMASYIFESIGGREIINVARNDTVNGQSIVYSPIKNLANLNLRYNPLNIVSLQDASNSIFRSFAIDLSEHIPSVGDGPNGNWVYIEPESGSATVDLINLDPEYEVEIQIVRTATVLDDTIY